MFKRVPRGLIGNAAAYIFAAGLNAAIPFLLLPLIARWLGPADFGIVGSFVAVVNVLILLVGLNAYGFVGVGYYRDGPQLLPRLVGAAVLIILVSSVTTGMLVWIGAGPVERLTGVSRAWLWTLPAAAAGQAVIAVGLAVAQTIQRPFAYGALQIGYGLALAVLVLLLVGAFGMGWPGRALAQALAAIAASGGAIIWLASSGRMTTRVGRDMVGQALGFGVPLLPHSLAAVAMGSMDRLALTGAFSTTVVGHYFLALQIASVFTAIASAVNQAWVPWLYARLSRNDAEGWAEITHVIQAGGVLLAMAAILMAALASVLVGVVGGSQFAPAAAPLRMLSFYAAFQAWYSLMSAFLFYAKRPKLLSLLTVSTAVLQGVLILLFLRWGASGVAAALLLTSVASAVVISFVVRRYATHFRDSAPSAELTS